MMSIFPDPTQIRSALSKRHGIFLLGMLALLAFSCNTKPKADKAEDLEKVRQYEEQKKPKNSLEFGAVLDLLGKTKHEVYTLLGDPWMADEEGNDIMKNWLMIFYDETSLVSQILVTVNTEAGSYAGSLPPKYSASLTAAQVVEFHGEPDQTLENEYFHILDYTDTKGLKFVFDRSNKKLFRIYFIRKAD